MPKTTKAEDASVVNINLQLKGEEAALLTAYQNKEFLRTLSSAARKGLLEHLHGLKAEGKLAVGAQSAA